MVFFIILQILLRFFSKPGHDPLAPSGETGGRVAKEERIAKRCPFDRIRETCRSGAVRHFFRIRFRGNGERNPADGHNREVCG